jgi:dihydrolipoamide dehydrogenase
VPLAVLRDTIQPFPTFSEIYVATLKTLRNEIAVAGQPADTTSP